MSQSASTSALLAVTAVHVGFQLVVTAVVYPAFAEVKSEEWVAYHAAHSRRITGVVVVVYGLVLAGCGWVLIDGAVDIATAVSVVASGLALLVTVMLAAPAHRRLTFERRDGELAGLRRADYLRSAAAMIAALAAGWAALT